MYISVDFSFHLVINSIFIFIDFFFFFFFFKCINLPKSINFNFYQGETMN
jgi:hypothetical protein